MAKNTNAALAALQAELDAARAELDSLKSKKVKVAYTNPKAVRRAAWMAPATPIDGETILAQAIRLEREACLVASFKAIRAVKWDEVPALLAYIVEKAAVDGGMSGEETADTIFAHVTTKAVKKEVEEAPVEEAAPTLEAVEA